MNLHRFLEALARQVALRSVLRDVTTLTDIAPGLCDEQLRARALTLLITLAQHSAHPPE